MMRRRSDLPPADPQPWSEMIPADSVYARLADLLPENRSSYYESPEYPRWI
jgi:hypothetical protein